MRDESAERTFLRSSCLQVPSVCIGKRLSCIHVRSTEASLNVCLDLHALVRLFPQDILWLHVQSAMDPASVFRSRSVKKSSSRQPRGRTTIKLPCTAATIRQRNSPAINTEQLRQQQQEQQQQQQQQHAHNNDDEASAAGGSDGDDLAADYDDGAQPLAPGLSAAAVRYRFSAARQRQPRSAAANRAASERNWAQLQQPDGWIATLHDRVALSDDINSTLKLHIEARWVCCRRSVSYRGTAQQHRLLNNVGPMGAANCNNNNRAQLCLSVLCLIGLTTCMWPPNMHCAGFGCG